MWKKATLGMAAVLLLILVGKLAYDRGYSRGQTEARMQLTAKYVDTPERFLSEVQMWCTAEMLDGYKTLGLWQVSTPGAQQKLLEQAEKGCKEKVREAALRLTIPAK